MNAANDDEARARADDIDQDVMPFELQAPRWSTIRELSLLE